MYIYKGAQYDVIIVDIYILINEHVANYNIVGGSGNGVQSCTASPMYHPSHFTHIVNTHVHDRNKRARYACRVHIYPMNPCT